MFSVERVVIEIGDDLLLLRALVVSDLGVRNRDDAHGTWLCTNPRSCWEWRLRENYLIASCPPWDNDEATYGTRVNHTLQQDEWQNVELAHPSDCG